MNFYVLDKPNAGTLNDPIALTDAIKAEGFSTGEASRCPSCNRFLSMLKWLPPYRVELETWGREYGDFADVGEDMIVTEQFVRKFQDSNLKGLSAFDPIEVVSVTHHLTKPKQPLPHYFKATVTHSPTTVDQRASGYIWSDESKVCPACLFDRLKRFERIFIKQETWNGDDIFFPRGGTRLMVSERFKLFCAENRFLGVVFKPSDQESYNYFPWEREDGSSRE